MLIFRFSCFIALILVLSALHLECEVNGRAFLEGHSDHSNIKVKFQPNSATAELDSTYTRQDGSYNIDLKGGLYKIIFSKDGYKEVQYNQGKVVAISENDFLDDTWLQPGKTVYISGNVEGIWKSDITYIVNANIILPEGKSLTIEPGTQIRFNGYFSFLIYGSFTAIGSPDAKIVFTSNLPQPRPGNWKGFEIRSSQSAIECCIIEYADMAFCCYNNTSIINNDIRFFLREAIEASDCSVIIKGNMIHDYNLDKTVTNRAIMLNSSSGSTVECNLIYNGNSIGIRAYGDIRIENNFIHNIKYYDNVMHEYTNGSGMEVGNTGKLEIANNFIYDCINGIKIETPHDTMNSIFILNNTIVNNKNGIEYQNSGHGRIFNNIISGNRTGIWHTRFSSLDDTVIDISYNLMWNGSDYYQVYITGLGDPVTKNSAGFDIDPYFNMRLDPFFISANLPVLRYDSPAWGTGNPEYSANIGFDTTVACYKEVLTDNTLAISDKAIDDLNNILAYPSPSSDYVFFDFSPYKDYFVKIEVYDQTGKIRSVPYETNNASGNSQVRVNISGLETGIYFYRIICGDSIRTGKFIAYR